MAEKKITSLFSQTEEIILKKQEIFMETMKEIK